MEKIGKKKKSVRLNQFLGPPRRHPRLRGLHFGFKTGAA